MATVKNFENPDKITGYIHNPVQVYCRLRPLKTAAEGSNAQIRDLTTVLFPYQANAMCLKQNYVFKQVFDEDATQADVYNVVARPLVERLVRGGNSLLFTYGVTGSGKTYTMAGTENQCGILPRCLKTLFHTVEGYHAPKGTFQSDHLNGFEIATEFESPPSSYRETTRTARTGLLRRKNSDVDFDLESMGPVLPVSGIDEHNIYAVFVSYVEIYNNSVYDLLEEASSQKALQSHIVREDSNHNMYIHGVVELQTDSVQEAIDVFQIGQKRKRMAQTALNDESSRSHSIFNVRLVQAPSRKYAMTKENLITISQLSLVDLAGSERSFRTNNTGARLRESGKINNSLMKLRECLACLRENQQSSHGSNMRKIPYRDSKLTYLFKNFFEGVGQVSMIVCIHPDLKDHAENLKVLQFAEDTQKVQIVNTKPLAISTPLKRQAWNKENTELMEKFGESKMKFLSAIKKPMQCFDFNKTYIKGQSDLNEKKIVYLEKQNLELRVELAKIREAYKKEMGRSWCNNDVNKRSLEILATTRKPLLVRQKTNIFKNTDQTQCSQNQNENIESSLLLDKSFGSAFQNELRLRLQKQRKKLEESLIEPKKKYQKRPSPTLDNKADYAEKIIENEIENEKETRNVNALEKENMELDIKDTPTKNLAITSACHTNMPDIKSNDYQTPKCKKMKFDECIQMDVFASFRMMTPKKSKHSTPYHTDHAKSSAKRKLDFYNEKNITPQSCKSLPNFSFQKDSDFDKREKELSLKLENHRKTQRGNKYLMDILYSIRRTKTSTNLYHKSMARKNLFPEKNEQCCVSDEEL